MLVRRVERNPDALRQWYRHYIDAQSVYRIGRHRIPAYGTLPHMLKQVDDILQAQRMHAGRRSWTADETARLNKTGFRLALSTIASFLMLRRGGVI